MLILLDCRPLQLAGPDSEKNRLIVSTVAALAGEGVEWLFVIDHTYREGVLPGLPAGQAVRIRAFPGPLGWKLWYDRQLPRLIRKYEPAMVMLTGGVALRAAPVPQLLWMPADADPNRRTAPPLYASRLEESLLTAKTIFCFSEKDRTLLTGLGSMDAGDIVVVRPVPSSSVTRLTLDEKERLKQRYTEGKEYFFTEAGRVGEEDVVQLLKAFSLFKKRQLSNLRLVIAGKLTRTLRLKLETYKYRQDVQWVDPDGIDPMPGAYATLFPFGGDDLGSSLLNAWKAGVPALVADNGRLHEMAGDAALTAGISDPAALAGHMMSVYKDERLRNALVEKGASRLAAFDPPPALTALRMLLDRHNQIIK